MQIPRLYILKARDKFKFRVLRQLVRYPGNLYSRLQNNWFPLFRAHTKFKRAALRERLIVKEKTQLNSAAYELRTPNHR